MNSGVRGYLKASGKCHPSLPFGSVEDLHHDEDNVFCCGVGFCFPSLCTSLNFASRNFSHSNFFSSLFASHASFTTLTVLRSLLRSQSQYPKLNGLVPKNVMTA